MTETLFLNCAQCSVELHVSSRAEAAFRAPRKFFRHSLAAAPAHPVAYVVRIIPLEENTAIASEGDAFPVTIRSSSVPEFDLRATVVCAPGCTVYSSPSTRIAVFENDADADSSTFELAITGHSLVYVIEFLRDLVLRHLENAGVFVLHAAGVLVDGNVIAIAGRKGAGKTTTLLHALAAGEIQYFTGDKMLCRRDGEHLLVYPWRDWPCLGAGTVRRTPWLQSRLKDAPELFPGHLGDTDKRLIDPELFESWVSTPGDFSPRRLSAVLLPRVDPRHEGTTLTPILHRKTKWAHFNAALDRTIDTTFYAWQSHLVVDYANMYAELSSARSLIENLPFGVVAGNLNEAMAVFVASLRDGIWSRQTSS